MVGRAITIKETTETRISGSTSSASSSCVPLERSASVPETVSDLKETFPRYASAWNACVATGSDCITLDQATGAVSKLLTIPRSGVEEVGKLIAEDGRDLLGFHQFCRLIRKAKASASMDPIASNPQEQPKVSGVERTHALGFSERQQSGKLVQFERPPSRQEEHISPKGATLKGPLSQAGSAVLMGCSSPSSITSPNYSNADAACIGESSHMFSARQQGWQTIRAGNKENDGKYFSTLHFSPDAKRLAAAYVDGGAEIYEATDNCTTQLTCTFASKRGLTNLRWQPGTTSRFVATTDASGCLCLWDLSSHLLAEAVCVASIECLALAALSFSGDGTRLLTSSPDRRIQCFDLEHGLSEEPKLIPSQSVGCGVNLPGMISGHCLRVRSLCAHPHNRDIFISAGLDRQVLLWDLRIGKDPVGTVHGTSLKGDTLGMSRDGNTLFTASHCGVGDAFQFFDIRVNYSGPGERQGLKTAKLMQSFSWSGDEDSGDGRRCTRCEVFTAAWDSMSEKTIAAGGENDNLARVYQMPYDRDGPLHVVSTLKEDRAFVASSISADGRNVAFGTSSGKLLLAQRWQLAL